MILDGISFGDVLALQQAIQALTRLPLETREYLLKKLLFVGSASGANETFHTFIGWWLDLALTEAFGHEHFEMFWMLVRSQILSNEPFSFPSRSNRERFTRCANWTKQKAWRRIKRSGYLSKRQKSASGLNVHFRSTVPQRPRREYLLCYPSMFFSCTIHVTNFFDCISLPHDISKGQIKTV